MLQGIDYKYSYFLLYVFMSFVGITFPNKGAARVVQLTNFPSDCTDLRSISLTTDGLNAFFVSKCDLTSNNQNKVDQIFHINLSNQKTTQVTRLNGNQISSAIASGDGSVITNLQLTGTSQLLYATASNGSNNALVKKISTNLTYDRIQDYLSLDFYGQKVVYTYSRFSGWGCDVPSVFIADIKSKEHRNILESDWCNFPAYIPKISGNGDTVLVRENWWSNGPFDLVSINTKNGDISPIVKDAPSNFEVMSADLSLSGAVTVFAVGDYLGIFGFEPPFSLYKSLAIGGKKYKLNPCKAVHDSYSCMASPSLISVNGKSIISRLRWDPPWGCSNCDYYPDTLVRFHGNGDQVEVIASADDRKYFINLETANVDHSIILFSTNKNLIGSNENNISQLFAYIDDDLPNKIPVVLVHGFNSNRKAFGQLEEFLELRDSIQVFSFDYSEHTTLNLNKYPQWKEINWPIERIAGEFGSYICETVKGGVLNLENGSCSDSKSVDVVAHSMGGLVSRAYMAGMATLGNDSTGKPIKLPYHSSNSIRKLVMAGTPNYGVSVASLAETFDIPLVDLIKHPQIKQLAYGSQFVWNLHWAWRNKLKHRTLPTENNLLLIAGTNTETTAEISDCVVDVASAVLPEEFLANKDRIRYLPYKHTYARPGCINKSPELAKVVGYQHETYKLIRSFLLDQPLPPINFNPGDKILHNGLLLLQFYPVPPDCIAVDGINPPNYLNKSAYRLTLFPLDAGNHTMTLFAPENFISPRPFNLTITEARPNIMQPIQFQEGSSSGIECTPKIPW